MNSSGSEAEQPLDFSKKRTSAPPSLVEGQGYTEAPIRQDTNGGHTYMDNPSPAITRPILDYPSQSHVSSPVSPSVSAGCSTPNECDSSPARTEVTPDKQPFSLPPLPQLTGFNSMLHEALNNNGLMERYQQEMQNTGLLTTVPNVQGLPSLINPALSSDPRKPIKYTRPFKAYPRDPLSVPLGYYGMPLSALPMPHEAVATQSLLSGASDQAYLQFREQMLVARRNDPHRRSLSGGKSFSANSDGDSNGLPSNPYRTPNGAVQLDDSSDSSEDKMCNMVGPSSGPDNHPANLEALRLQVGLQLAQYQVPNRKRSRALPEELKDEAYWERRRKNNEAAKRSRDARRAKEDEIAIRAAFLEQENLKLRVELSALKSETAKLRCVLSSVKY